MEESSFELCYYSPYFRSLSEVYTELVEVLVEGRSELVLNLPKYSSTAIKLTLFY